MPSCLRHLRVNRPEAFGTSSCRESPLKWADAPDVVELFAQAETIFVPFVVVAELRAGFRSGTLSRRNEATLVRFLNNDRVTVLYPDDGTSRAYAELYAELRANGTPIPTNDLWIAALAVQHNLPLATRDSHFALIPQLDRL